MVESANRTIKSTQEQAVASWITYLNQNRLDELVAKLNQQDINLEEALKEIEAIKQFLGNPNHILGSTFTKHGEIAEHMQVNFSNARRAIQGLSKNHTFDGVARTAPEDYIRDSLQVQSKFYYDLRNTFFGKNALSEHLKTYPDFIKNGGSYDIPKDQYEKMIELLKKYKYNPSQLSTSDYHLAKKIDDFLKNNNIELNKNITPSIVNYDDVQQKMAKQTVDKEEKNIKKEDEKQRKKAYNDSKSTLREGIKASEVSAAVEGGVAFCMSIAKKRKEKNFSDFSSEDWKEIGIDTGKGTVKGGIRGGSIYILTNFTATPAHITSAYVTATFGVISQLKKLESGKVSKKDFIINCETLCLDVTVSAIASIAGQVLIPIPVLGAVIGNVAGEFVYELCKKYGTLKSQRIIENNITKMKKLNQQLDIQYLQVVAEIQKNLQKFKNLEELAFDKNTNIAFKNSAEMAAEVGVADSKILSTRKDIDNFFLI